ncbi:MAG TPA: DUF4838 domain-containing protein [Draconibacterium sp.]|nr:DUF4838 domain-containing protein [Draconibacterium sp.]
MKKLIGLIIVTGILLSACSSDEVKITRNSKAVSRIVISENPTEIERYSAKVLQKYLYQISGAELKIVSDVNSAKKNDIQLGKVDRKETSSIDFDKLEEDGFVIQTHNKHLIIAGGSEKGTLYGVYSFLEKHLGCRKYTSRVSFIPRINSISVQNIIDEEIPVFKFREVYYRDAFNQSYREWHGLDSNGFLGTESDWGSWCHTMGSLVPPEKYAKSNADFYSMRNGKRTGDLFHNNRSDICFSNEGALDATCASLTKLIEKNPAPKYWSVSQMDNAEYCTCPKCQKAYDEQGSTMGTILPFVNEVAKRFPDKTISTLSYWYSTRPPKNIKPEKNVNIMLCNIGSPRHIPIEEGDSTFCSDLEEWAKIHDNIILWDYVIQFANLLAPFPNLRTLQPNLQYLNKNGVVAMFEQANRDVGGEFCELKAYLFSKLLWDPYQDMEPIIDDFVTGYYGAAAKYVREYIDLMHDALENNNGRLSIFGSPWDNRETFLSEELIQKYYGLLEKGMEVVADDPDLVFRVRTVKNQIDYAVLDIAKREVDGERGAIMVKDGKRIVKPEIEDTLAEFLNVCELYGVTRVHEWHTPPREYVAKYRDFLKENTDL